MVRRTSPFILLAVLSLLPAPQRAVAQTKESVLTYKEIEQLREVSYFPDEKVAVFIGFLDDRSKAIQDIFNKPRRPGREEDVHDLIEQFNAIADELEDNVSDFRSSHRDLRKVLPKLVAATERWGTGIKSPPDDKTYSLSRKLALDAIKDIHDDAVEAIDEQKDWFQKHPPPKETKGPIQVQ
jgi:hypothetical protein